ncbi:MAG: hypothetical protein HQM06_02195 [Magnetococcales bacterium]|nr:hypothetical protein [Magnetococcales bacterium]
MSDASMDLTSQDNASGLSALFYKLAGIVIALFVKADPFLTPATAGQKGVPFETE